MAPSMIFTRFLTAAALTALIITPIWANSEASGAKYSTQQNLAAKESIKEEKKNNAAKSAEAKDTSKEDQSNTNDANAGKAGNAEKTANAANAAKNAKAELAAKNLTATQAFLEDNKKKPGVVTTSSGLQYKIVKEGKGKVPGPSSFVTVNYTGTLTDGTVFDSSTQGPVTFAVNAVIPGWTEALQLMKEGSKWIVYVPPQLAYGEKGIGRVIGPNQLLVFEIELVDTDEGLSEDFKEKKVEEWEDAD